MVDISKNKEKLLPPASSFIFAPAVSAGLVDSVNPCALVSVILFALLLLNIGNNKKKVFFFGIPVLLTVFVCTLGTTLGMFDSFISKSEINTIIRNSYLGIGLFFLVSGGLSVADWWKYKKSSSTKSFFIRWPRIWFDPKKANQKEIISDSKEERLPEWLVNIFMGAIFGIVISLLDTISAQNVKLAEIYYELVLPGREKPAIAALLLYSFVCIIPLILTFYITVSILRSERFIKHVQNSIPKVKMIIGALLLGFGFSLSFIFL